MNRPDVCAQRECATDAIPGSDYCGPHDEAAAIELDRTAARIARRS